MSPNRWEQPAVFLQSGDPENENTASLLYPGLLGVRFTVVRPTRTIPSASTSGQSPDAGRSKTYQLVQTDSSMTVAPYASAVAWWSDKTKYLVTTSQSKLGRGRIAGVFRNAITPGNYGCVQVHGPALVKFLDSPTATPTAAGLIAIPSATDAKADCLAAGSSATYPPLGVTTSGMNPAYTGGPIDQTALVDLDIPETT